MRRPPRARARRTRAASGGASTGSPRRWRRARARGGTRGGPARPRPGTRPRAPRRPRRRSRLRDLLGVAALPDDGRALERAARGDESASVRSSTASSSVSGRPRRPRRRPAAGRERRRELLDVERDAVRALVQDGDDVLVERLAGDRLGEPRRVSGLERPQRELDRLAHPAQLGAQAAQAVRVGRHLVARDRDQQQRHLAQPGGDAAGAAARRLVGPVEVVEHDRDGPARGHLRERAPQRLDQRRLAGIQCREPELGQQRREVRRQRPARLGDVGRLAQALAQHLGDGVVRLRHGRARRAAERREPRCASAAPASQVLPMPASPVTSTHVPVPSCTAPHAASKAASSSRLPIIARLSSTARV